MFFPLWEASAQVTASLGGLKPQESVAQFLDRRPSRITVRRKLRVVLFRDASEYRRTLRPKCARHRAFDRVLQ